MYLLSPFCLGLAVKPWTLVTAGDFIPRFCLTHLETALLLTLSSLAIIQKLLLGLSTTIFLMSLMRLLVLVVWGLPELTCLVVDLDHGIHRAPGHAEGHSNMLGTLEKSCKFVTFPTVRFDQSDLLAPYANTVTESYAVPSASNVNLDLSLGLIIWDKFTRSYTV